MDASLSEIFARWRASGDPRILAEVFDRAAPELLRVAIHLVGEVGTAEDLVQATFLTAIERAKSFDDSRRLEPWLAGILENHARELVRHAARTPDPARLEQRLAQTPLDEALARELSAEVAAAVDRLPEPYRRTLLLRVRHGLAPADIAHVLDESAGTVRVRLHRAIEMLRKQLPAGIALGALFALEPARGMSSVKAAVLAAGGGGVLVVKKVLVGAGMLALLLLAWWKWPAPSPEVVSKSLDPASARLSQEPRTEQLSTSPAAEAARTVAQVPVEQPVFHFRGRVVDGESGEPIANATVDLHPAQHLRMSEIKRRCADVLHRDWNVSWQAPLDWPFIPDAVTIAQRADQEPVSVCVPPLPGELPLASVRSASDGSFELLEQDPRGFYVCSREGYATRLVPMKRTTPMFVTKNGKAVEEQAPLESLLVRMYPVRHVQGFLLDEQGQRLHERIRLRFDGYKAPKTEPPPVGDPSAVGSWPVETDAQGAFAFDAAAHQLQVTELDPRWSISNKGINPENQQHWIFALSWEGAELDKPLLVIVRRTPVLRVHDRATHEPIEDLLLVARAKIDGDPRMAGRFFAPRGELRLVREQTMFGDPLPYEREPVLLTVWAAGYAPATVEGTLERSGPDLEVELARGELPLAEGLLVRGGQGLPGVSISITPEESNGYGEDDFRLLDAAKTDEQGRFGLRLPVGFYVLRWTVDGVQGTRGIELPLASPLVIDLGREAKVVVHVRDASGAPRANHVVILSGKSSGQRTRHTDAGGDAIFDGLGAGPCTVMLPYATTEGSFHSDFVKELELLDGQSTRIEAVIPADEPRFAHLVVAGESDLSIWRAHVPDSDPRAWHKVEPDGRVPIDIQKGVHSLDFDHDGRQRWQFSLPKDPPPDLVLPIDLGGPAYEIELIDAVTRKPVGDAAIVAAPRRGGVSVGPAVSALTDQQGIARLTGMACPLPDLFVRLRSFEPHAGDLLRWDHGWAACGFEPTRPGGFPAVHLSIELPTALEGRFTDLPELHLTGSVRLHGSGRSELSVDGVALLAQADGTLAIHAARSRCQTAEGGRYDMRLPLTPRARMLFYDPESKKSLDPIEWEPTPGLLEQQRDFDFP